LSIDPIQVAELQKLQALVITAGTDPTVRQKLLDDPAQALKDANVTVPPGVTVTAYENTDTEIHLVLPPLSQPLEFIQPGVLLARHIV
jgi:hypothetical protein